MDLLASNIHRFLKSGVMAIIRIDSPKDVDPTVEALVKGGIEFIEVSLVTPHALKYTAKDHAQFRNSVMIAAGTVLDSESARAGILAGADFIVSPNNRVETIPTARRYGKLSFAGAFTPSECLLAKEAGVDAVKLFPAENLRAFFKAGVCGVAGASNLADPTLIASGSFEEVTQISARWLEAAREARES